MAKSNPFRFSTKRLDNTTDLMLYEYRAYSPSTGRWPNRDPIGERGGVNLYGFVSNQPVGWLDTDGRDIRRGNDGPPVPRTPPDPIGFALCIRDVNPEGLIENVILIGFRIAHPRTPTDHAYLHYKHCKDCERVGWGIGGTKPGTPPKKETVFNPTDCKSCKKTDSLLQYGAPGKKGTEATDSEILDCISKVPTSKKYKPTGKGRYNCMDWAKEAASTCGLDCN